MKKFILLLLFPVMALGVKAQDLPKDVQNVYKGAEHLKSKKRYKEAISAYKEVLRSVEHVPSMVSIADIDMNMCKPPNYREAYKYYDMAIKTLDAGISSAEKKKQKSYLTKMRDELIPKRNKAKSYVDDFDKVKEMKKSGERLFEEEGLN